MSSINKHVIPVINVALKRAVGIRLKTRFSLDARVHIGYLTPEIEKNDVSSAKTFSPVEFDYLISPKNCFNTFFIHLKNHNFL